MNDFFRRLRFKILLEFASISRRYLTTKYIRPRRWVSSSSSFPHPVVFFAGERDFPELYFSVQSFHRYVGVPAHLIVVSDGSMTDTSRHVLRSSFPHLDFKSWTDFFTPQTDSRVSLYARRHPLGKKLGIITALNASSTEFLFSDSDILYFPNSRDLHQTIHPRRCCFLVDCLANFDSRIPLPVDVPPTNTGLLFFANPIPWSQVLDRVPYVCLEEPTHHTEQTIIHLALQHEYCIPFPEHSYIVSLRDQFVFSQARSCDTIAARHFVRPVRHKFWTLPYSTYRDIFHG